MGLFQKLFGKANRPAPVEQNDDTIDLAKVFPRIKGVFPSDATVPDPGGPRMQASQADSPVFETFAKELGIFYAIDRGNRYQLLQNKHLSDTITLEKLHEAALKNMAAEISDKSQINGDPANIMMLTNGGNFEAAMILMDGIWENLEQIINDQVCIAIPARDLLFIAGKNNPVGRESLRAAVRKFFDEQETQGLIVRHIYVRENNQWVFLETA